MKLLAIEAGQYAVYYQSRYRQLEQLGAEIYVLNGEGTPDFWPAGRYRLVGSKHIDDMVAAARAWHAEQEFDGIFTVAECAVIATAAIADRIGLPGIGVGAALASRNKLLMRQAHERGGAPHPRFRFVADVEAALGAAKDFSYPVVLKPTLGAGSTFVFRIDGPAELRERFHDAERGVRDLLWPKLEVEGVDIGPSGLLIESYLDGHEHLIEAVVWDDEVYLGSIVDRVTVEGDTFDDDVHHAPTVLSEKQIAAVHRAVTAAAHAQGLRRAVMHAEVRFHRGEPHILEIGARPGGGGLDYMSRTSAGYCPIRATLDVARGVRPEITHFTPTDVHTAAMCLISGPGRVQSITVPSEVTRADDLMFLKVTAHEGDVIKRPPEGNNILGFLGVTGPSFAAAMRTAGDLAALIDVRIAS